jgi:hypothetical protein
MIENKKEFQIYIIANFIQLVLGFMFVIFSILGLMSHDWIFIKTILAFIALSIILGLLNWAMKPSYIETIINEKEIIIRTFNPDFRDGFFRNGSVYIKMLNYKKHLKELRLSKQEYNNYKLSIDKLGFHKLLILQKVNKKGIYETSEINISLLGARKYTNLILSLDRLRSKISLN